ncbi:MAG TPA: T9SS type A sorting domain-containing protein [Flavobacteriales bacterium]|nr:T9SS type A sorting domain-containing protein [Flavobacteriales bacterium]
MTLTYPLRAQRALFALSRVDGRVVQTTQGTISLDGVADGIYLVRLIDGTGTRILRVQKITAR